MNKKTGMTRIKILYDESMILLFSDLMKLEIKSPKAKNK
jgi:hypothetical protein